jgi:hypothetical protein
MRGDATDILPFFISGIRPDTVFELTDIRPETDTKKIAGLLA